MAEMPSKVEFDVYMVPKGSFVSSSRAGTVHLGTVVVEPRAIDSADVASQVSELLQQQTEGQVTERLTGTGIREVPS